MARLYGHEEKINPDTIKNFFNERAKQDVENLMITSFHDKNNLEKRQAEEIGIISEKLNFTDTKLLEIGCGTGRWAEFFHERCNKYVGIDYAENLIEIAKNKFNYENCYFKKLSATEISDENLPINGLYDVIFITGVLKYLNDKDILTLIEKINKITHDNPIIYIRETISVLDKRLTLKDFYSTELEVDYNAIYRTEEELLEFFKRFKNNKFIEKAKIYEDLNEYEETSYEYFIIR